MARINKQQIEELRALSEDDLMTELNDTYRELFTVRLQLSTRQLANTSLPRKLRRRIARIETVRTERERAAAYAVATEAES